VTGERPHNLSENYLKGQTILDVDIRERLGLAAIGEVVVVGECPGSVCVCVWAVLLKQLRVNATPESIEKICNYGSG
jgi:hypothetical protein